MTAPVPPDANGLREAACEVMHDAYEAAAQVEGWETQERSRKPWSEVPEANKATMRAAVGALLDFLAASEAAPTAGEQEHCTRVHDGQCNVVGGGHGWTCVADLEPLDSPATPPADDASEPNGYRVSLHLATGDIDVTPAHVPVASTDASEVEALTAMLADWLDLRSDDTPRDTARRILASDWLAARESAAATRARAEGAAEALREYAASCDRTERGAMTREAAHFARIYGKRARDRADSIARSDAAPHTGEQS